jgi:hypothetical protein
MSPACSKRANDEMSNNGDDAFTLDVKKPKVLSPVEKAAETVFIHDESMGKDPSAFLADFARIGRHIKDHGPKVSGEDMQDIYDNAIGGTDTKLYGGHDENSPTGLFEAVKVLLPDLCIEGFVCTFDADTNNIVFTGHFDDIDGDTYDVRMEYEDGNFLVRFDTF